MRYIDGTLSWDNPTTIVTDDDKSLRRIISYLVTRNQDFACVEKEGEWCIFISDNIDLSRIRDRLSGVKFELWK